MDSTTTEHPYPNYLLDEMWYGTQLHNELKQHCPHLDVMSSVDALHVLEQEENLYVLCSKLDRIFVTQSELYLVYNRPDVLSNTTNAGLIIVQGIGNKSKTAQSKIGLKLFQHPQLQSISKGKVAIFKKVADSKGKLKWSFAEPAGMSGEFNVLKHSVEEDFQRAEKKASTRKNLVKLGHTLQEAIAPPVYKYTFYVANLSFDTTEQGLGELFSRFKVDKVAITKDKNTGRSKGYGFVSIQTPESSQRVVTMMNGRILDGRPIKVQKAKAPTRRGSTPTPGGNNNNNNDNSAPTQ